VELAGCQRSFETQEEFSELTDRIFDKDGAWMSKFHTANNIIILCWNTVLKNGQVITFIHKASAEIRQCC
jgi:hypothetical protein